MEGKVVAVFDFDDTLCPSREVVYDMISNKVKLVDQALVPTLQSLDEECVLVLKEAQKYAHVSILSNGNSTWVYTALESLLPKTLDHCCRSCIQILTGPDLYMSKTDDPLIQKKLGFADICFPFKKNLRMITSIGDGLPEYLACIEYFRQEQIPQCRAYRINKMEPANMKGQVAMLQAVRQSLAHYLEADNRPFVDICIQCFVEEHTNNNNNNKQDVLYCWAVDCPFVTFSSILLDTNHSKKGRKQDTVDSTRDGSTFEATAALSCRKPIDDTL